MFEKSLDLASNPNYLRNAFCVERLVRELIADTTMAQSPNAIMELANRFGERFNGFDEETYPTDPEWHMGSKLGRWVQARYNLSSHMGYLDTMRACALAISNATMQIIKDSVGKPEAEWQREIDQLVDETVKLLMGVDYPSAEN